MTKKNNIEELKKVRKKINNINNNITTNVTKLNETERVEEIARMVSGSVITNEAREAASKLLNT